MWDGAFSPTFKKSIGTVRFIPLSDMSPRDWRWLDFENIRTVARNRIAAAIMTGRLRGFFQVKITEKAAKNEYFWPATREALEDFDADSSEFFRNESEVNDWSVQAERLEELRVVFFGLPPWLLALIAKVVAQAVDDEPLKEQAGRVTEELLDELTADDRELLLSAILMWEFSLDEAERLLDDLPESDEVDEVRDQINDRVAAIEQARRQIAAGRGLS